jgi:hypothetical protein
MQLNTIRFRQNPEAAIATQFSHDACIVSPVAPALRAPIQATFIARELSLTPLRLGTPLLSNRGNCQRGTAEGAFFDKACSPGPDSGALTSGRKIETTSALLNRPNQSKDAPQSSDSDSHE